MKFSTRIARTLAVATIAVSGSMAVAPTLAGAAQGPAEKAPPTCTHGCDGDGGGFQGPGDLTTPTPPPVVDPDPGVDVANPDGVIVVAQPTFTG